MEKLAINGGQPIINRQFPTKLLGVSQLGDEEKKELAEVIDNKTPFRHYGLGIPEKVYHFEEMVAERFRVPYPLALTSGSAALFCAAYALGLGPGDEVILPTLSWYSDFGCIVQIGATPVFAGIDETLNLDPADFEAKLTPRTKAVIVVHYQGGAAKMDEILSIAKKRGVAVIEDIAQAFGGMYKDRILGTIGDVGVASFQMNKMITAGEGGLLITSDKKIYEKAVRYHDLGFVRPVFEKRLDDPSICADDRSTVGQQYRMGELAGAVLCAQFLKLDGMLNKCGHYHKYIKKALGDGLFSFRPTEHGDCGITIFIKFNSSEEAQKFIKALAAEGVPIGPSSSCVNMLTAEQTAKVIKIDEKMRDATEEMLNRYLAIGIGPSYDDKNIEDIISAVKKVRRLL